MAKKKKENTLSYLQMPLPQGGKYSKMTKVAFSGLNKRYTLDSGDLTMESNISNSEYPYLTPSEKRELFLSKYDDCTPITMSAFDDFIIVVYYENKKIMVDYITSDGEIFTGIVQSDEEKAKATYKLPRSIVQFNVYDTPTDPLTGKFVKKLLIFPDKKSMDFEVTEDNFEIKDMDVLVKTYTNDTEPYLPPDTASHNYYYRNLSNKAKEADTLYGSAIYKWVDDEINSENSGWKISIPPTMPDIKYATVHLSRVFGVDDDRVYASGYNDYTNWNLDTIDEYNESNSWCSPSQSNTKAGGSFTGITTYQNHVICFKRDFMHEIYNTKNPFRLQDVYAEGTIDNRTIQDVDGKLIFVSEDDVKIYTGSNPRIIGYNLNMKNYKYAVSGTDNRNYYLYCEDERHNGFLYVYDTFTELWSEQSVESRVLSFAHNKNGMYMLCEDGCVYKMDTKDYKHKWSFETDLITNKTVNIKHIKKLQMLVDILGYADDNGNPANMQVYILYDDEVFADMSDNEKAKHLIYSSVKRGKFPIRVKPRKTANYGFKLHFEGAGYVKLYELEIFVEPGGDLLV
jgi:hypothetical protein